MAKELDKLIFTSNNSRFAVNPLFFKSEKQLSIDFIKKYISPSYYVSNNKVIDVFKGRGTTYIVRDDNNKPIVIRHYWRGGVVGNILKDKFLKLADTSHRAFLEYDMLLTMRKMGLPVPRPIVAREINKGMWITNDIVVEAIIGAKTITSILCRRELTQKELCYIGYTVGKFFKAGVYHSDLNINNILFDGNNDTWIIDFDKCDFRNIDKFLYKEVIQRLRRSFLKEKEKRPIIHWNDSYFPIICQAIDSIYKTSNFLHF
ncbi:MAG: 3-deoxy-D-manno-octulosonic acid kinase [Succinivibrionaceae bacterium]